MEVRRLPVWRTCILAIRDSVAVVLKAPILCLVVFMATMVVEGVFDAPLSNAPATGLRESGIIRVLLKDSLEYLVSAPVSVWICQFLILGRHLSNDELFGMKNVVYLYAGVSIVFSLLSALFSAFADPIFEKYNDITIVIIAITIFMLVAVGFLCHWCYRWILIYPAIAVEHQNASLRWSARTTKGMVWRIFLIHAVTVLVAGAIPLLILSNMYRPNLGAWFLVLSALSSTITVVVCTAISSRIYMWFRDHMDPSDEFAPFYR